MKNSKQVQHSKDIQLELFQSTQRLNLSETYEAIPKDVYIKDTNIEWINDDIANPIEKIFTIENQTFISEIVPATIKDKKTKKFKSRFPDLREARIEYAIISLASKQLLNVDTDKENNKIFVLKTTYYQIQKEIIDAINKQENKALKPYDCPYNVTSIKEALEVLKMSSIRVKDPEGGTEYLFNRIKDIYLKDKKVVIELGNMITNYISSGDWKATDQSSIIASRGRNEIKLRVLLNMKFRYATLGSSYSSSLSRLVEYTDFAKSKDKRTTIRRIKYLLKSMPEIEKFEVNLKKEGNSIIDAVFKIYPTKEFVSKIIENNKVTKRTKDVLFDEQGKPLIEPIQTDYSNSTEFQKARKKYNVEKGKAIFK
jgi:hypothetical protein